MYQRLIEEYLSHYHPSRKADLLRQGMWQQTIESQNQSMLEARLRILDEMRTMSPLTSQLQLELETDQQILELFLPLP